MKPSPLFCLAALLTGCSLAPDYVRPPVDIPAGWRAASGESAADAGSAAPAFASLGNEEMRALIARALQENNDIAAAFRRVEQARASVRVVGAGLFPQIGATGSVSEARYRPEEGDAYGDAGYRGQLSVTYEADLWGRIRSARNAAELRALATEFDRQTLALVIAADTAQAYAAVVTLNERIRVAEANLQTVREVLAIIEARFEEGAASGLELSQQRAAVTEAEAAIEALRQQREAYRNQLAVLTGQAPQGFALPVAELSSLTVPEMRPVLPAELLTRRPDLRAAEANLRAAHIDIGTARAAFFPTLSLGLDTALAATPVSAPATLITSVASSLAAPIFRGGALEGELERTQARREELVANYRQAVLTSFQEVQTALSAVHTAGVRLRLGEATVVETRNAHAIARERFDAGAIDYQTLLDTQRALLRAEDSLVQIRQERLSATVDLYRALGGEIEAGQ